MGIEGLLSFLKPITQSSHISNFENQTVAVDAMSWLYRGCYSCSFELNMNIKTKDYLYYINKCVLMLKRHKIKPILVFDGRRLLVKKKTEDYRKKQKQENIEKAQDFLQKGDEKEARKYFSRAIKITKEMIYQTMDLLRQLNVDFILAPYEADAQIAFLIRNSYANLAISEDSDLICYGCPKIILKLGLSGECQFLNLLDYKSPLKRIPLKDKQLKAFLAFDQETIIYTCIMAGCDYLPSIKGIGIKKAVDFLARFGKIEGTVRRLQFEKTFMGRIPEDYAKTVKKIALVFKYQRVFNPQNKTFTTLDELPEEFNNEANNMLIGEEFEEVEAFANGDLDIKKLEKRDISAKSLNDLFKLETETMKKIENLQKKYEKNDVSARKNQFETPKRISNYENRSLEITSKGVLIEDDIDLGDTLYNNNENRSEEKVETKKNGYKTLVAQIKMDEEIDFLFDICKGITEEFVPKEKNKQNLNNLNNNKGNLGMEIEKNDHKITEKQNKTYNQNQKNEENEIVSSKDFKQKKTNNSGNSTISKEKTSNTQNKFKIPLIFQKKHQVPENSKKPTESKPKNSLNFLDFPYQTPSKTLDQSESIDKPSKIVDFHDKTNENILQKPKDKKEILMKSPENPFLVKESSQKQESLILDSLTKISTEKLNTNNNNNGNINPKDSANNKEFVKLSNITPIKKNEENKSNVITVKKTENLIKNQPQKRKDENRNFFEGNFKENKWDLKNNNADFAGKRVKVENKNQTRIQNFYAKVKN